MFVFLCIFNHPPTSTYSVPGENAKIVLNHFRSTWKSSQLNSVGGLAKSLGIGMSTQEVASLFSFSNMDCGVVLCRLFFPNWPGFPFICLCFNYLSSLSD